MISTDFGQKYWSLCPDNRGNSHFCGPQTLLTRAGGQQHLFDARIFGYQDERQASSVWKLFR
jgi:hypothetical protein